MASSTNIPISQLPQVSKLREIIKDGEVGNWDQAWKAKVTPWDNGMSLASLRELIESGEVDLPKGGKVIVGGCGAGYDVIYLSAALESSALGLDASETAIETAKSVLTASEHAHRDIKFEQTDFFTYAVPDSERFDLAYDYTFFVAIPPKLRVDWGRQMAALIKPGGFLITLVYPIDPPTDAGPPYFVRVEHYEEVLAGSFVKVYDKIPTTSIPSHVGREQMVVWKRI